MKLILLVVGIGCAFTIATALIGASLVRGNDHFSGLARVPANDYTNQYQGFKIVCEAWTNQPDRDFTKEPGNNWVGVRYVRDCRVVSGS